jgi:hypothetical protein
MPLAARGVLWMLAAYLAIAATGMLWWPMGFDQGAFAWVGDVILRGGVPYRDAWEVKGPATYATAALSQLLLGRSSWGLRLVDLCLLGGALFFLGRLVARVGDGLGAWTAGLLLTSLTLGLGWWNTAQPDGWASLLVLIALERAHATPATRRSRAAAGALVGVACLYKPPYLACLAAIVALELMRRNTPLDQRLRGAIAIAGASAAVLAVAGAWMAGAGALAAFLEIQLRFLPQVYRLEEGLSWSARLQTLASHRALLPALPLVALGVWRAWREDRALCTGLALLAGTGAALLVLQGKYFLYQWAPLYGPLAAFAGLGPAELRRLLGGVTGDAAGRPGIQRWLPAAAVLVTLLPLLPVDGLAGWRAFAGGEAALDRHRARFFAGRPQGAFSPQAELELARYLREHTTPDDAITVWGSEPVVYYLSGRRSASRFGFTYPLIAGRGTRFFDRYRVEFIRELEAAEPAYLVVADHDPHPLDAETSQQHLREFPELMALLNASYLPERQIGDFQLWRRRTPAQRIPPATRRSSPVTKAEASLAR